jgi:hypothetical protein
MNKKIICIMITGLCLLCIGCEIADFPGNGDLTITLIGEEENSLPHKYYFLGEQTDSGEGSFLISRDAAEIQTADWTFTHKVLNAGDWIIAVYAVGEEFQENNLSDTALRKAEGITLKINADITNAVDVELE